MTARIFLLIALVTFVNSAKAASTDKMWSCANETYKMNFTSEPMLNGFSEKRQQYAVTQVDSIHMDQGFGEIAGAKLTGVFSLRLLLTGASDMTTVAEVKLKVDTLTRIDEENFHIEGQIIYYDVDTGTPIGKKPVSGNVPCKEIETGAVQAG